MISWHGALQVMQMFDKAEAGYRELSEKKRIVENDKDKIRRVRWHAHWSWLASWRFCEKKPNYFC